MYQITFDHELKADIVVIDHFQHLRSSKSSELTNSAHFCDNNVENSVCESKIDNLKPFQLLSLSYARGIS